MALSSRGPGASVGPRQRPTPAPVCPQTGKRRDVSARISHMETRRGPPRIWDGITTPVPCKLSSPAAVSAPVSGLDTPPNRLEAHIQHPNPEAARRGRCCAQCSTGLVRSRSLSSITGLGFGPRLLRQSRPGGTGGCQRTPRRSWAGCVTRPVYGTPLNSVGSRKWRLCYRRHVPTFRDANMTSTTGPRFNFTGLRMGGECLWRSCGGRIRHRRVLWRFRAGCPGRKTGKS
jgi:hypothetical protein